MEVQGAVDVRLLLLVHIKCDVVGAAVGPGGGVVGEGDVEGPIDGDTVVTDPGGIPRTQSQHASASTSPAKSIFSTLSGLGCLQGHLCWLYFWN